MTMTTKHLRRLACSGAFILLALCTGSTRNTPTEVASGLSRDATDAKSLPFKAWTETGQDEPFVLRTTDQGAHWNDVSGKLAALVSDRRGDS